MRNFEEVGRELERRGKTEDLKRLAESQDGVQVGKMVDPEELEKAARDGDGAAMRGILNSVLSTDEGKRLAENLMKLMGD